MLPRSYCIQDHQPFCSQRPAAHVCFKLTHLCWRLSVTDTPLSCSGSIPSPMRGNRVKGSALYPAATLLWAPEKNPKASQSKLTPKRFADLLLADTGLAEGDLACLTASLPTMGKLQPQDPGVDNPGTQLGSSCSQKRGCNTAVNLAICLGSCRFIICLQ